MYRLFALHLHPVARRAQIWLGLLLHTGSQTLPKPLPIPTAGVCSNKKNDLVMQCALKRFKDEVNEVRTGMECGIQLDGFDDFKEGDIIECYMQEKVAQKL